MRIGTAYAQQIAIDGISERQSRLVGSQSQLATGKRVATPSDDPVAAAEAERIRSSEARIEAEKRAVGVARQMLSLADNALGDADSVLQSARESLIAASNATAGPSDRARYAEALKQVRDQLLAIANRGDGAGGFVFGGQGTQVAPIDATGTVYSAVPGSIEVGIDETQPITLDGQENFTAIRTSSGSESIFARLDSVISLLSNASTTAAQAKSAAMDAVDSVDRAMDRLSSTRTMVGERLKAVDAHEQALESGSLSNQSRLSDLVDVDFAKAISEMSSHQIAFDAAIKSYAQIARLTLFSYV